MRVGGGADLLAFEELFYQLINAFRAFRDHIDVHFELRVRYSRI